MSIISKSSVIPSLGQRVIKSNDYVIVRNAEDKASYILQADSKGDAKIQKSRVRMKALMGEPFTSYFELQGRDFRKITNVQDSLESSAGETEFAISMGNSHENIDKVVDSVSALPPGRSLDSTKGFDTFTDQDIKRYLSSILEKNNAVEAAGDVIRGDNSLYVDTNTAQLLTDADISKLREKGLSGEEIIKTLIMNSKTFGWKTDFAQEKWIKRKEKKYRKKYQILPPNPATICEASYSKNRDKVCNMRHDTLAQILSQSGVHAGAHVLVIESTVGMIVGALAYRMGGMGRILAVYGGQQPHFLIAGMYNLEPEYLNIVQTIPSTELAPAAKFVRENGFSNPLEVHLEKTVDRIIEPESNELIEDPVNLESSSDDGDEDVQEQKKSDTDSNIAGVKRRRAQYNRYESIHTTGRSPEALQRLRACLHEGVDRLIIACKYRPLPILKQALQLLAPSCPFVVYHEFLEPLIDCYLYLQQSQLALRLVLSDTWMREFQTLPGRMRPDMFMTTSGGFLLTGIYIGLPRIVA